MESIFKSSMAVVAWRFFQPQSGGIRILGFARGSGDIALPPKGKFKTSFNYCSSGSGQNSVIPVVCDLPE